MNRDLIDDKADRYFFVADPVRYDIEGGDDLKGRAPLHPDHPERGWREYHVGGYKTVYLSEADSLMFSQAGKVRLKVSATYPTAPLQYTTATMYRY